MAIQISISNAIGSRYKNGVKPANTVAPAITGTAQDGQTVTCSTGTWTGNPTPTYAYQWKRNGSNIGSATSSSYLLVTADVGQSITCQVTATNGAGSASATSNTITPIAAVDPDAQAFITAASITNPTQQSAINQLVLDLKGYSIWTKFKAIYPIVGGVASSHAVNLKTPGIYNLSFTTGWTHSANGMTPSNAFANTNLIPLSVLTLNSSHVSYYSRTNVLTDMIEMGSYDGSGTIYQGRFSGKEWYLVNNSSGSSIQYTDANTLGLYVANRTASNVLNGWKNGTKVATGSVNSTGLNNYGIYLGGWNYLGSNFYPSSKQCAFASIGDGLTDTETANFYTAVQAFQTTLSRQV